MNPKRASTQSQSNFLYPDLLDHLDPKQPLMLLSKKIPWDVLEKEFADYYSIVGRPAKPVRLMVGLLLLKQMYNMSDDRVVEIWRQNPYFQAFCGVKNFQWKMPCEPSDLTHFRNRIGEKGAERIFQISVEIHGDNAKELEIVADTTVQEKNITFPTDAKLRFKVMTRLWKLAESAKIVLRRSYKREVKDLARTLRFRRNNKKAPYNIGKRLKTIANALLRDIMRKLPADALSLHREEFALYARAINQNKNDRNKIYSLHEPQTACIAKGKEHKKYEFGSKAAVAMTKDSAIIVGVKNFQKNEYDGNTLPELLASVKSNMGLTPKKVFCDRGFRGRKNVAGTDVEIPGKPGAKVSVHYRRKAKKNFGRRSAIEPVIGHLKNDFRMARNYLKGVLGDKINLLLAATAFNCKKWMRLAAERLTYLFFVLIFWLSSSLQKGPENA